MKNSMFLSAFDSQEERRQAEIQCCTVRMCAQFGELYYFMPYVLPSILSEKYVCFVWYKSRDEHVILLIALLYFSGVGV